LRFAFAAFAPHIFDAENDARRSETIIPSGLDVDRYARLYARESLEGVSYALRHRYGNQGPIKKGGHYYDTFHAFLLNARIRTTSPIPFRAREHPLAVCGFSSTDEGDLVISQIQALPLTSENNIWGERHRHLHERAHQALGAIRFERLLVHVAGDWARMCGLRQVRIQPAASNKYYHGRPYARPFLRLRYDGTARALRFHKPTEDLPYWWRDVRSEWSLAPGWTPGQRS
jgi:hypothetical protein